MDFAIQADHRMKIKENEKINKHLDLVCETSVTVILIVIGAFETVQKGLE